MAKKPDSDSPTSQATDSDPEFTAALVELNAQVAENGAKFTKQLEEQLAALPDMLRAAEAEQLMKTAACDIPVPKALEDAKVVIESAKAVVESARSEHAAVSKELETCEARLRDLDAIDLQEVEHALEERNLKRARERITARVQTAAAAIPAAEQGVRDAEQKELEQRQMYLQARVLADENALAQWSRLLKEIVSSRLGAHVSLVRQEHAARASIERGRRSNSGQPSSIVSVHDTAFTLAWQAAQVRGDNVVTALGLGLKHLTNARALQAADFEHARRMSEAHWGKPWETAPVMGRSDPAAADRALQGEVDARRASRTPTAAPRAADYDPYPKS